MRGGRGWGAPVSPAGGNPSPLHTPSPAPHTHPTDSITAGAHSSGGNHPYPQQLQLLLDPTKYSVTNLGACGSTMQKGADSPYWKRPQFAALTGAKWDVIVIMLGTNDAKDAVDGGPPNWVCGSDISNITVQSCRFSQDYLAFIDLVRTLGPDANTPPKIYVAAPPPLMAHGSIGANQTVINTVYPTLIPLIGQAANVTTVPISVYAGMGGVPTWETSFPKECTLNSPWAACPWYCDAQSCDQCHVSRGGA